MKVVAPRPNRATQADTQTSLIDIKDEPLFEDELASEAT
jgi:hypothetical protein